MKYPASFSLLFVCASFLSTPLLAQKKKEGPVFTDPVVAAKESPDFLVQGEYAGELGGEKFGMQVIALGDQKFDAVIYMGGLPGDGWSGDELMKASGETKDGKTTISNENGKAVLEEGVFKISDPDGNEIGSMKRVERKSETLGKKAPEGAVVLFDGSSVEGWKNGKMTEEKLLQQGTTSKETYTDATIHLEFRTPFKPKARGQGRGNSGFYAQGRYEVQILDSFGLEGKQNECGGVYSVGAPKLNMCYPPLSWQTYDIEFTGARFDSEGKKTSDAKMTVHHNGVIIHKDLVCDHITTAAPVKKESADPGPVFLQNHGNPVRFQNIWIKKK